MAAVCGLDWAADFRDVRIADEHGRALAEPRFDHNEHGIAALIALLAFHGVERVAIERPETGCWSAGSWTPGCACWRFAPTRSRLRATASAPPRARATASTRWCSASSRTDSRRFERLAACSDQTLALRTLVRAREDLVATRIALANQLRAQLDAFWPGAARIFTDIDSPIAPAFLERDPSPHDARGLGEKRFASFLARHGYCGRRPAAKLLDRLRSAPAAASPSSRPTPAAPP